MRDPEDTMNARDIIEEEIASYERTKRYGGQQAEAASAAIEALRIVLERIEPQAAHTQDHDCQESHA